LPALALALGLLIAAVPACAQPPSGSPEQQIEDVERQIEELKKELEQLKGQSTTPAPAASDLRLPPEWLKALSWRSIGPANMGGRFVGFSVYEPDPCTWRVATARGGLLKTMNNGITFEHQFDKEATVSIGDLCVARSDGKIVWVQRNSRWFSGFIEARRLCNKMWIA
jgi:hypothetical protein